MQYNEIMSPVTRQQGVTKMDSIDVEDIVKLYKTDLKLDVRPWFGDLSKVDIMECNKTGYRFYYPLSVAGDGSFYEKLQVIMDEDSYYYRPWGYDHEFALNQIEHGESVLDVGCGSGNFLKKIKEKTDKTTGLEFNQLAIQKCREAGLTVYSDTIEEHARKFPATYDVVCLFQVLEHIHEINPFMDAAVKLLKKGGKLIVGVPNNEPYYQGFNKYSTLNLPPHHMGLWNKNSLDNLGQVFDLKLKKVEYNAPGRLILDVYFRAKKWWGIKSLFHHHSFWERFKMAVAAPFAGIASTYKKLTRGINGGYIVVLFQKQNQVAAQ